VLGVSVDTVEQSSAMVEKLLLRFSLDADVDGAIARSYGVWDEEGQIARPAIFVIAPTGVVSYAYVGEDFVDRPGDDRVYAALAAEGGAAGAR
jgi:peroxiredoxin